MGFLIRSAFWLSLVLLIIPIETEGGEHGAEPVGPVDAFIAARAAFQDVAGICERRPEVCLTGRAALDTIGARAREGARMAYGFIDEDEAGEASEPQAEGQIMTGSVAQLDERHEAAKDAGNGE